MFGRKKSPQEQSDAGSITPQEAQTPAREPTSYTPAKGAPTPTRKEREAARKRPLVPNDRKAAREANRLAIAEQRAKVRMAMETGDERNMPFRDRGPQKRLACDYVDARLGVGEWLMVIVLAFLMLSFVQLEAVVFGTTVAMLALVFVVVAEGFWVSFQLKKQLETKFGNVDAGVRWYGTMRAMQLRRLRLPKPQVKRGQFPR